MAKKIMTMKKITPNLSLSHLIEMNEDHFTTLLIKLIRSSMVGMVAALEAKDEYSKEHSIRVATMSKNFANELNLKRNEIEQIYLAATCHDIGKIGIPDSILLCPSKLNDEQWAIMKSHTIVGAKIVDQTIKMREDFLKEDGIPISLPTFFIEQMNKVKDGVLYHHERWDGKGYPEGKKAGEIPYCSRILAICDSCDAMLSNRVYRKKRTEEFCKEEIEKNKGVMYDPELATFFLEHWNSIVGDLYKEE